MAKFDLNSIKEAAKEKLADATEKGKAVAEKGVVKAKEGAVVVAEQAADAKYELDLKRIRPITKEQLEAFEYTVPSLIQVVEHDKKMDNPVCAEAFGFQETIKGKDLLCVMNQFAEDIGISFKPYLEENFYCKNPYVENEYIRLDDYFSYIDKAKVAELKMIAQSLGAKKIKVSLNKKKKTLVSNGGQAKAKIKLPFGNKVNANANLNHNTKANEYDDVKIMTEPTFAGDSDPTEPELCYFKGNAEINSLIAMRLSEKNRLEKEVYLFDCGRGKELQQKDAAGIDAVLEKKGFTGNASIVSEVQEEQRKVLEYSIEF